MFFALSEAAKLIEAALKRDLPTLLTGIAAVSEKPLKLFDFIVQARRAAYRTVAKSGAKPHMASDVGRQFESCATTQFERDIHQL